MEEKLHVANLFDCQRDMASSTSMINNVGVMLEDFTALWKTAEEAQHDKVAVHTAVKRNRCCHASHADGRRKGGLCKHLKLQPRDLGPEAACRLDARPPHAHVRGGVQRKH